MSNRFVDGFEYLDKICQMAIHSHTQVNRQTLCGYEYGLLNWDLTPNPSYFSTILFKRLIGHLALNVTWSDNLLSARFYAFCAKPSGPKSLDSSTACPPVRAGDVVVVALNLNQTSAVNVTTTALAPSKPPFKKQPHAATVCIYTLTSQNLTSDQVSLNGESLYVLPNGSLPPLAPLVASLPVISLPPLSYSFLVYPHMAAPLCGGSQKF